MADSFGPMRDEDADDGVVGMGPDGGTSRKEPIRVLVVDDHALFRRGLEIVLAAEEDIQVVGEAGDGAEAVDKAADLLPDIVLMDVRMPQRGGIEACTSIKEVAPSAKIIMLTISDEEADLYEAIKAGATGYLLKEISTDEVATAIRAVADGQSQISPSMASKLLTEFKSMIQRTDERRLRARAAAHRPGAGGAQAGRHRDEQPGHRQGVVHLREHREEPRAQHPGEAPAALQDGGGGLRDAGEDPRDPLTGRAAISRSARGASSGEARGVAQRRGVRPPVPRVRPCSPPRSPPPAGPAPPPGPPWGRPA